MRVNPTIVDSADLERSLDLVRAAAAGPTEGVFGPSSVMWQVDREAVTEHRRANYRLLLERLGELVAPAFRELPPGASPLQFPVVVSDKPRFLERLAAQGVEGADAWPISHPSLPTRNFPSAAALRSTLVGLPVHHELRDSDLDRVAGAALKAQA